jgi:3-phosphoshikimate 1-carboxyvinyltransferase
VEGLKVIDRFPGGSVTPPPSKSLCHRAVICAALAARHDGGVSLIENFGRSEDVDATLGAVRALGLAEAAEEGGVLRVGPPLSPDPRGSSRAVDCGESGSTLRFLIPVAALSERKTVFTGRGRLLSRLLGVYAEMFSRAGAGFVQEPGRVTVGGLLRGGSYSLPGGVSSQFVSGLLLALPLLDGDSEIRLSTPLESGRYVDLTIGVMRRFGVEAESGDSFYSVRGGQRYRPACYRVEADYSQAAFFLAAAALGRDVRVSGLNPGSLQGDRAMLGVMREMGAETSWDGDAISVRVDDKGLRGVTVDAREIPDLVPPIAALCCFCEGESRIVNAGRLRLKESDRLSALASELGHLGADVAEEGDGLRIIGASRLRGGAADAWGDHRIAMAVAVAAIRCENPVSLSGSASVNKSYPGFWRDFERGGR